MKHYLNFFNLVLAGSVLLSCNRNIDLAAEKESVKKTEKEFEKMASEKSIMEAFLYFADDNAVVNRNDSLYKGKNAIRKYFESKSSIKADLKWAADFVDISDDGTLGYSYGKYQMTIHPNDTTKTVYQGIYNTIWKKQKDGSWKYVWD
ncbi:MAG: hypothetical protein JST57_13190 [Bacteroidetes bacterium]|nr:hypothetical protein [Bacteroidota bacterium]HAO05738.1 hypothetical protein [Chryseobacterium sp.]